MNQEIEKLMTSYTDWFRSEIDTGDASLGWTSVAVPFLDHHNDYIEFYVGCEDEGYVLSDDGWAIREVETSGVDPRSPRCVSIIGPTLRGLGVEMVEDELRVFTSAETFGKRIHDLIQAMLYVSDLSYLAGTRDLVGKVPGLAQVEVVPERAESLNMRPNYEFSAGVSGWLDHIGVEYTPKAKVTGASGLEHEFDFAIASGFDGPRRYLQTFQRPTRASAAKTVFAWTDTLQTRSESDKGFAILNDVAHEVKPEIASAIGNVGMEVVPWSERELLVKELAI